MTFKIQVGSMKAGQLIDAFVQAYLAGHDDVVVMDGDEVLGDFERLPMWAKDEIHIRFIRAKNRLTEKTVTNVGGVPVTVYSRPASASPSSRR